MAQEEEGEEERILGVWTREEFMNTLIFAAFMALAGFLTTLMYRYVAKWIERRGEREGEK